MDKPSESLSSIQYAALGEFIASCSRIEVCIHAALDELLGLRSDLKSILVGEPRYGDLQDLLKRVAKTKALPEQTQEVLAVLLADGALSNNVRAVVAHKMVHCEGDDLVFTNHPSSRRNGKNFEYRCTAKELKNLSAFNLVTATFIVVLKLESTISTHRYMEYLTARKMFLGKPLPSSPSSKLNPKIPKN